MSAPNSDILHRLNYPMPQGVIHLTAIGYVQVHAYASNAQIPLKDVAIMITDVDRNAIAFRITDRNGYISPVEIEVPNQTASQTPNNGIAFAVVNIHARIAGYEQIEVRNVQVFPQTVTVQDLEMIPLSEFPDSEKTTEYFDTPAQNL